MTEQVGQYELKGVLGGGGMATVYRGEHVSGIGMVAAVKKLHPHLAIDEDLRARLKVEAQALARLKHRNIVQIFDYVDVDGSCALVTELVEGRTLRAVMGEFTDWPMPLSMALRLFRQVLEGVAHAHRHNCLHRDLKPGNIMVTSENEVKVLDFGIANLIDTEAITRTGVSIGTPVYMAPEQLEGRRDLDQRADLYSLGMTLWEMLAGHGARPIGERGWRLREHDIENLLNRDVPASLVSVVRRLVQEDRDQRYMNCEEVLQALSDIVDDGGLDEESRIALAGVGPVTASELPTFEFEATAASKNTGPLTQTIIAKAATGLSGLNIGKLLALSLILLAVAADLSQLLGEEDDPIAESMDVELEQASIHGPLVADSQGRMATPITLRLGEEKVLWVGMVEEVSIGDPEVIDVKLHAESSKIIVFGLKEGYSTLTVGRRSFDVTTIGPEMVSLLLLSEPQGARMRLDGVDIGTETQLKEVPAERKDYLLTAQMDGYREGSELCQVRDEAIVEGSLRCMVSLRRIQSSRPAAAESSAKAVRPVSLPKVDEPDKKTTEEAEEKPTIHKID